MPKIVEGGKEPFGLFENPVCFKISKKKSGPFRDIQTFSRKNKRNFEHSDSAKNFQMVDPLGFFNILPIAKDQKKMKAGPSETFKSFREKFGRSHPVLQMHEKDSGCTRLFPPKPIKV